MDKVGLVLGGGGARGFFHIGVIKGLQDFKINVDEIAGTSIGAIIGAMWASNPNVNFDDATRQIDLGEIIQVMIHGERDGNPDEMINYIKRFVVAKCFEDLKIKLKFNATDINGREEVIFKNGDLFPGLLASMAVPGIVKPIEYQGKFLVDGGIINNLPVTLIEDASTIIISDITGPIKKIDGRTSRADVLSSSVVFLQQEIALKNLKEVSGKKVVYLKLDDDEISILDHKQENFQKLIYLGYKAVMEHQKELKPQTMLQ
jgi:NTE family protein